MKQSQTAGYPYLLERRLGTKQWLLLYSHFTSGVEQVIIVVSQPVWRTIAPPPLRTGVWQQLLPEQTWCVSASASAPVDTCYPSAQGESVKQHHRELLACAELIWQAVRTCPPACSCSAALQAYGRLAKRQQYVCLGAKCKEAGTPALVKPGDTNNVTFRIVLVGLFSFPAICRNSIYMPFAYALLLR